MRSRDEIVLLGGRGETDIVIIFLTQASIKTELHMAQFEIVSMLLILSGGSAGIRSFHACG